jgi:transposase
MDSIQVIADRRSSLSMIAIECATELSKLEQRIEELLGRNHDLEHRNQELEERNQELEQENQRLRDLLNAKGASKGSKRPKFKLKYSVEKNQVKRKHRHPSTGRRDGSQKLALVTDREDIYPSTVHPEDCVPQRKQYAWRIIDGKAAYLCYTLYDHPDSKQLPNVPGLRNSRSEYGLEIILIVAFLHYWIGISLDHVCDVLRFFTGLDLPKSQADSLLTQLSTDWSDQYDTIAELLAVQLVIYIDETGWKVGKHACYTWAFSTAMHVLFRCGVGRGKAEAQAVLGEKFSGIGVSDDYGVYQNLFEEHQLCWAHLLRKAIKLMLQHPDEHQYAECSCLFSPLVADAIILLRHNDIGREVVENDL